MNHDDSGVAVFVPCAVCGDDTCNVHLGCRVCLAEAVSAYCTHVLIRHPELAAMQATMIGSVN